MGYLLNIDDKCSADNTSRRLRPKISRITIQPTRELCSEPPPAFIRFTLGDGYLQSAMIERFLPMNMRLCSPRGSSYSVRGFLRNDSHADVYRVYQNSSSMYFEAHVFLNDVDRKREAYATRKWRRLCQDERHFEHFKHQGRSIVVMRMEELPLCFRRGRNYHTEFPPLNFKGTVYVFLILHQRDVTDKGRQAGISSSTDAIRPYKR